MHSLRIGIGVLFGSRSRSVIVRVCVHMRKVDEVIHSLLALRYFEDSFGFGDLDGILFIVASRGREIACCLESIRLTRFLRSTIVIVRMRAKTALHIKSTKGTMNRLLQSHLTLTSINAHDLFLNSGREHIFFRSVLLVVWNASFSLILDDPVLAFHHLVVLLLHFFDSEQKLFSQTFVILFQDGILFLHVKHVLLHL